MSGGTCQVLVRSLSEGDLFAILDQAEGVCATQHAEFAAEVDKLAVRKTIAVSAAAEDLLRRMLSVHEGGVVIVRSIAPGELAGATHLLVAHGAGAVALLQDVAVRDGTRGARDRKARAEAEAAEKKNAQAELALRVAKVEFERLERAAEAERLAVESAAKAEAERLAVESAAKAEAERLAVESAAKAEAETPKRGKGKKRGL